MNQNARKVALSVLTEVLGEQQAYANVALDNALSESQLTEVDKGFTTALVYGVLSRRFLLDWFTEPFVKKARLPIRLLLALTVYQIQFMDRVPASAAVDEAVKIARQLEGGQAASFVNAVLRNFMRSERKNELPTEWTVRYSMPKLILDKFVAQYGGKRTQSILESLEEPSRVSIRVVHPPVDLPDTRPSEISPDGLTADKGNFVATAAFQEGKITLQDESSQLVAPQLELTGTEKVLDACAAPGGKTTHIAQYLTTGTVTACDIYDHKLAKIEENAERLQLTEKITTVKADATQADRVFAADSFDRILVDAPCSGLGLMRRKPDIRYRKSAKDFEKLPELQLEILTSCAKLLKKDGIMVYSTCTLSSEENAGVVEAFLKNHPNFISVPCVHEKKELLNGNFIEITPEMFHTDGFFIAKFQKI